MTSEAQVIRKVIYTLVENCDILSPLCRLIFNKLCRVRHLANLVIRLEILLLLEPPVWSVVVSVPSKVMVACVPVDSPVLGAVGTDKVKLNLLVDLTTLASTKCRDLNREETSCVSTAIG